MKQWIIPDLKELDFLCTQCGHQDHHHHHHHDPKCPTPTPYPPRPTDTPRLS